MAIRVGRKHEFGAQYIGRGSALGNPFVIGRDGDRDEVCEQYQAWFNDKVADNDPAVMRALERLYRLANDGNCQELVLGCFCAPKRCHGETIKRFLDFYLVESIACSHCGFEGEVGASKIDPHGMVECPGCGAEFTAEV